jgi:hypothetical protein
MSLRDQDSENELDAAKDCLRRMLVNLIKAGLTSTDKEATSGWRSEVIKAHQELTTRFGFLSDDTVKLDLIWIQAREEAQTDGVVQAEESVKPVLQASCMFKLRELMAADLNAEAAAARIRVSAATG